MLLSKINKTNFKNYIFYIYEFKIKLNNISL